MEEDKSVEVLDEMVAPEKKVIVSKVNEDKIIEGPSKVVESKHGKGKIALTIDAICTGVVAIFEILREMPGFEYIKTMTTGNLITKFNNWIASITTVKPNLEGLTPEEIFELGKDAALAASNASANSWGLVFSAVLEFIIQHPTATIAGVSLIVALFSWGIKSIVNKSTKRGIRIHEENMKKLK